MVFGPATGWKSRYIMHLAPYPSQSYPQILLRSSTFYFYCLYLKGALRLQIETQDTIWGTKHESIRTINRYTC